MSDDAAQGGGDDTIREQAAWDEGYAAGREQAIREAAAWLRQSDLLVHASTLADALEGGALDSAPDEPEEPRPERTSPVPTPAVALVPGVTHGETTWTGEAEAWRARARTWLASPPMPEDVADPHAAEHPPAKDQQGEHGF